MFLKGDHIVVKKYFHNFEILVYRNIFFYFNRKQTSARMPCSAVTLSLATITAIVAVALLAIAFSTDNWLYIDVKRAQIHQVSSIVTSALSAVISLLPFLKHYIPIALFSLLISTFPCQHVILWTYKM